MNLDQNQQAPSNQNTDENSQQSNPKEINKFQDNPYQNLDEEEESNKNEGQGSSSQNINGEDKSNKNEGQDSPFQNLDEEDKSNKDEKMPDQSQKQLENQNNEDSIASKIAGIVLTFKLILSLIPLAVFSFSIYWMTKTPKFLLNAIGSSILIANIFLMFLSLGSSITMVGFVVRKVNLTHIIFQIYSVQTIISLFLCIVLISLSTPYQCNRYYNELIDYCNRNANLTTVGEFVGDHSTQYSRDEYIYNSIAYENSIISAMFGTWIAFYIFFIILNNFYNKFNESSKNEK